MQSGSKASADTPAAHLPARVTAVGYGTTPTIEGLSPDQRRMMAIRASKLDAYRSLAETVAGLKLTGQSTVNAATLTSDSFRVYVEAYLRGARVVSVTPLPGNGYETVLELSLSPDFQREAQQAAVVSESGSSSATAESRTVALPATRTANGSNNFYLAE
ncbi:LPP20 family lipoprotein [Chitinilyticum litopenaei]|uniref:LPP20 family lipoprotein n=2 Tax=Chitinilyticum piscinae TaxID=2866724 RepID=A0A8J7K9S9_9NEIS|nr:LPP20 family lipoprotein [Chitinilyticum piscinae]